MRSEVCPGDLAGLRYAVFGLGDSTYTHYNTMGLRCDGELSRLGAERLMAVALGDDSKDLYR